MRILNKKIFNSRIVFIILGIYQIFAGLFGLYLVFQLQLKYILTNLFYFIIIIGLFVFSIISGICLQRQKPLLGIKLSKVNQFLQIIQFKIMGYGFYYVAGIYLGFGFSDTPNLHFIAKGSIFQSSCFLNMNSKSLDISIVLNIIAILIFLYLANVEKYNLTLKNKI